MLPYLAVGQAQKHVTVNETLRKLDAVIQLSVVSATITAEPSTPPDGAVYIVPAGKSGTHWAAYTNWSLGYYRDGAWTEIAPREGWLAFVKDTDQLVFYTGSAWSLFPAAKILALSATDKLLGRSSAGAGAAEEIACTSAGRALLDDSDAAAQRATLGLGTAAVQNTGTSGANVPLLNGALTFSGAVAHTASVTVSNNVAIRVTGTAADVREAVKMNTSDEIVFGTSNNMTRHAGFSHVWNTFAGAGSMELDNDGVLATSNIRPRIDDTFDLGTASMRFNDVYATNGVIQTSDASEKTALRPLSELEGRAIRRVLAGIGAFQWLSARAEKGEDARIHCGVTAQAVKDAFEAEGLDPHRYALFCVDALDEATPGEFAEAAEAPGQPGGARASVRRPKLDSNSEPVVRLGVRYDQLFAMALAGLA